MDNNTLAGTMEDDALVAERFDQAFDNWKEAERRLTETNRRLFGKRETDILTVAPGKTFDAVVIAVGLTLTLVYYYFGGF
jgi:hypothetical protein